ncbi:hypothetical protein M758_8G129500 [Ceratodon purpureus]|nr:hypothetical protein M758_8G129500 [Ceratodon purpureus]
MVPPVHHNISNPMKYLFPGPLFRTPNFKKSSIKFPPPRCTLPSKHSTLACVPTNLRRCPTLTSSHPSSRSFPTLVLKSASHLSHSITSQQSPHQILIHFTKRNYKVDMHSKLASQPELVDTDQSSQ